MIRDPLIIEELGYFKYPTERVVTVEAGDIQFQVVVTRVRCLRYERG